MGTLRTHPSAWNPQPTVRYKEYVESLQVNMVVNEAAVYLPNLKSQLTSVNGNPDVM